MKKILFIMPILGRSGADRVIFTLLNNIDRSRFQPHLLLYKNDNEKNVLVKELESDVVVEYLNITGRARYALPKIVFGIKKTCKRHDIDTIFISSGTSNATLSPFLSYFGKHIKKIARESNLPSLFEKNFIAKFLYKTCYKSYDVIIAQSDDMVNDLVTKMNVPEGKIVKINNPLDYKRIKSMSVLPSEHNFPSDRVNLLTIGRLTYQKGYDQLLKSFSSLSKDKYHLTIVGEGEDEAILKTTCSELGLENSVTFIPATDNPYALLKKCDVFISSSRWEGYPNVVIEAITCGTPVLANAYPGGINEIINDNNGIICDITGDIETSLNKVLKIENVFIDQSVIDGILRKYETIL
ncbi:Mannosylfructose-phosphate synthase [Serratia liquefaciens]|uniref:glycosyltransferase n=1 Tax=Serratia TaxID=613 RepID=UPI000B05EE31|nr:MULTISPECIES: glycosyltransferase [Serratia]MCS4316279.1 glycosyltransferase involved in cell wall biosynthesis [Serratia sp. BIGb0234]CAI0815692.1 Mannosylfructose-phosphate synthase [Serratia liquefaciens]CAI2420292.1 Mannosylfructose-phosphate synthase [Serratia liquefaciens]CAI2459234.1 Mannosylfructose-phosphate synthase [Serratia liquefaciens]CAI2459499.1 Mannosylfructose-phosphate synthase [Serratia liquefaciens]